MMHTNAGQLTAGNTGLSERTAAILDANIEAAASAMARWQVAKYANMSSAAEPDFYLAKALGFGCSARGRERAECRVRSASAVSVQA